MKYILAPCLLMILVGSCNSKKSVEVCQTWPPNDSIGVILTNVITGELNYEFNSQTQGMHGVNSHGILDNPKDENDIKIFFEKFGSVVDSNELKEKCFKIKGQFYSQLGNLRVTSRFNRWSKLKDTLGANTARWGVVLDSGQIIISKTELISVSPNFQFKNNFSIKEVNPKFCLINITENSIDNVILIYGFNSVGNGFFKPIVNTIGTIVKADQCSFEAKSNGWYSNGKNITIKPK